MESTYKERLRYFELTLSDQSEAEHHGHWTPIIDTKSFREACFYGIPDELGLRATAWKVLLGYLPPDKRMWHTILLKQRLNYYNWVKDLLEEPGDELPTSDHPLNAEPGSKWATYFQDNTILEQIDKDVRRTLPDIAFFQLHVPNNPLNPLSPPPWAETEETTVEVEAIPESPLEKPQNPRRFSFGRMTRPRSSSSASRKSNKAATTTSTNNNTRSRSNSKSSVRSFSSGVLETDRISSPRNIVRKLSSAFIKSSPNPTKKRLLDTYEHDSPICPYIFSRRSLFRRIAHLNHESNRQSAVDERTVTPGSAMYVQDYHWEAIERILFIYAKLNPGVGYVQGMNELLAPIYYVFAKDPHMETQAHAEADAFFVFTTLMSDVRDHFVRSLDHDASTGINASMLRMSQRLAWYDRSLWRELQRKDIKEQFYAFRWITVLCSQEWDLPDVIRLWDSLLADRGMQENSEDMRFEFLLDFSVAMVTCVRQALLNGDFAENVRLLQNYPIDDIQVVLNTAYAIRDMRLKTIASGQIVPGVNDQRCSGVFNSDWSDTSSMSSVGSNNRLQRLRDSTEHARASFDSFRRESKESMDELFKKGLAIARHPDRTDALKRASMGDIPKGFSQRLGFLTTKMRRSGSYNGASTHQRQNSQNSQSSQSQETKSWLLASQPNNAQGWTPAIHRNMSISSKHSQDSTSTSRSSLLGRFSNMMISNTAVSPFQRHQDTPAEPPLREEDDEKRIFAKAQSAHDEALNRNSQTYRGYV
ncbi:rab-GTPase-TBC domain-containing protein [Radiomyces spectabilis]|uniref:rab-GTPase-TBC domain-containing protein n=1 Tax=Radiomyces spectabilis TaxID=64574 RepID=UPI00221FE4E0|nr:rab-GTPase-TBC domain-containing protein [Radiomyces spectabilis]KAI8388780.1 rab-GTPase-TBC domain-containing protein [Radiomyces spectabilis]